MAAPPPGSKLSYNPEPFEQAYYSGLFATADIERTGKIGGAQAVQFFQRSKLPVDALKNIWIVADSPPTNYLDPPKFAVAVRLIQCIQNGQKGSGTNLLSPPGAPPMRPAMFEGVSGVAVQLPGGAAAAAGPPPPGQQPPQQQPQQSSPPQQQQQPPPMNGGSSRALAVQDPYMLTPTDQARFEEMFPNYARDGYVHGGEAVALFSKSGMPQAQLAAIWNMVDSPVDNRLDKLEFAMAMHLIVCVSKRNLPMPPSLPASLQQLKSQQQQQQPPAPQGQQPQPLQQLRHERTPTYDSMASASMMQGGGGGGMHGQGGPLPMQQQQQPGMMMQGGQVPPSPQTMKSMAAGYGGMPGTAGGGMPQMQQPLGMQGGPPRPPMQGGGGGSVGGGSLQSSPKPMQGSLPPLSFSMNNMSSLQQPQVHTAPSSPGGGGGGGGGIPSPMAQPHGCFGMQQQQAVQYGGFAQQQREMPPPPLHQSYQGQVSPTMSAQTEPVTTKQPQHQVNVSSISISDAFEGLDTRAVDEQSYASAPQNEQQQQQYGGGHQYGGGIPEPESVTSDTPEKMPSAGGASESLKSSSHRGPFEDTQKLKSTLQKLQAENISLKAQLGSMTEGEREAQAELSKTVAEIGVLSNKLTTLRAQVLAAKSRLLETTAELKAGREKKSVMTDLIAEAEATRIAIDEATAGVESTITFAKKKAPTPPPQEDLFSFGPTPGQPILSQTPPRSNHHEPMQHIPTPDPVDDDSTELPAPAQFAPEAATPSRQEPLNAYGNNFGQPSRPGALLNADRGYSTGSNFGFGPDAIMGAGTLPTPGPSFAFSAAESQDRAPGSGSFDDVIMSVPSVGEVDALKMKAKEAADIARDAEESSRQALAQVNELRRLADEAEKEARKHSAEDDGKKKKKGFLGRSGGGKGKKADAKEAERLAQDANEKKQKLLQAQSQANDAQALALATKREAEKLRSEAEEAEIQAVSAASVHQQQQDQEKHQLEQHQQQQNLSVPSNGYGEYGDFGAPGYSYDHQQPFGGESGAFNPSVMGNGAGIEIPAPSGDPYDNPFGV